MTIEVRETCENSNIMLHYDIRMGGGKTEQFNEFCSILACF